MLRQYPDVRILVLGHTDGLGETRPVDTNDTDARRARNRRVEFVILAE